MFSFLGMALGKQIRFHRESQGLTLEQLSDRSGVDVGTISALEVRGSKRSQYAAKLASALGLSMEELIEGPATDAASSTSAPRSGKPRGWPFDRISPEDWKKLSAEIRSDVEDYIQMKIAKVARPDSRQNKHAA